MDSCSCHGLCIPRRFPWDQGVPGFVGGSSRTEHAGWGMGRSIRFVSDGGAASAALHGAHDSGLGDWEAVLSSCPSQLGRSGTELLEGAGSPLDAQNRDEVNFQPSSKSLASAQRSQPDCEPKTKAEVSQETQGCSREPVMGFDGGIPIDNNEFSFGFFCLEMTKLY